MVKKRGHYCKVCGEYKSNESFSGSGHSSHICKKCAALSPTERSAEMTMTRLMNLPWPLSSEQKEWLKGLQKDNRPEIAEAARAIYSERFPYAQRNERKKQLHIKTMTMTVRDELWDEYGDPFEAQLTFTLDRKRHYIACTQGEDNDIADLTEKEMKKLLNRIVNEYEVFCWDEDISRSKAMLWDEDEVLDNEGPDESESPSWIVDIAYLNGETQAMQGVGISDRINDLVLDLLQYFEEADEAYDEDFEQ